MGSHLLSKSSFLKGIQCEKHLYLYKHHYKWKDPISESQQAIFDRGTNVGKLAQDLFPGGIDVAPPNPFQYAKSALQTREKIKEGVTVFYEASFIYDEVLVAVDILVKSGKKWKVYEVKSSTNISETYIIDAAVQYYVLKNSGLDIDDVSIVHLNNQYVRQGELDLKELFTVESVLDLVKEQQELVEERVGRFKTVLKSKSIPEINIGPQCNDPYSCAFLGHCWKDVPEYSVFNISGLKTDKKFELFNHGIIRIEDVPEDYPLSDKQQIQVDAEISGLPFMDEKGFMDFLNSLSYPLYFMDFETFMPAVPLYDDSRPYQQIPFQYSLHYQEDANSALNHFEFLADGKGDPRISFIENLLRDTESDGDILVYNQSFEMSRLKEIARDFPQFANDVENRLTRIKDLMLPFQKKYYYKPEMKGSYSIKYVLPALVPDMSYKGLPISEGGAAMNAFESLIYETEHKVIEKTRKDLLEYCKMDTLAMVEILNKLLSFK